MGVEDRQWMSGDMVQEALDSMGIDIEEDRIVAVENILQAFLIVGRALPLPVLRQLLQANSDEARNHALQNSIPRRHWGAVEQSWNTRS